MITISVTAAEAAEGQRGKFYLTVRLSDGIHEEIKKMLVFRYFLRGEPFSGTVPATGDILSAEKYEALTFAAEASGAAVRAVGFLSYGDKTAKKLTEKLRGKGFSKEASASAVRFCVEKKYIREDEQLKRFMELSCEKKHYGLRRIRQEAYQKGFSEDAFDAVWEDTAASLDFDTALDVRLAKLGKTAWETPDKKRKTVASLLRYGFSGDEIARGFKRIGK